MVKHCFLTKTFNLRCSHKLSDCNNPRLKTKETSLHGHNIDVLITIKGEINNESGLIINRDLLDKTIFDLIITKYDKISLNDLMDKPTGENLTLAITNDLLNSPIAQSLHQVQIKETNKNFFTGPICNE